MPDIYDEAQGYRKEIGMLRAEVAKLKKVLVGMRAENSHNYMKQVNVINQALKE